jgi:hypothetical protein
MDKVDKWTLVLSRALDIIFVKYPARTGLGVILGCTISFLVRLLEPTLRTITFADFAGAPWWGWLPLGIFLMHLPTVASMFRQRLIGDDSIDQALELIERGDFTRAERRQHYRNLIERVASGVALSKETQREVKSIERSISQGSRPSG